MRKIATDADLAVGTIVFKSAKSATAWTITAVGTVAVAETHRDFGRSFYSLSKTGAGKANAAYPASLLWIEQ